MKLKVKKIFLNHSLITLQEHVYLHIKDMTNYKLRIITQECSSRG